MPSSPSKDVAEPTSEGVVAYPVPPDAARPMTSDEMFPEAKSFAAQKPEMQGFAASTEYRALKAQECYVGRARVYEGLQQTTVQVSEPHAQRQLTFNWM